MDKDYQANQVKKWRFPGKVNGKKPEFLQRER
jgi:hypothetical protein